MPTTHQAMVFRSRSRNNLRPINRIKHVVDAQQAATAGTQIAVSLIDTVDTPALADTDGVETGSTVNAIYLKSEVVCLTAGVLANIYMFVFKNPGANLTAPEGNVVGSSDVKKYVIHQEMVMMQRVATSNPRTLFNGVISIPRGYRRNGPDDNMSVLYFSPGINFEVCTQCHYKEFR